MNVILKCISFCFCDFDTHLDTISGESIPIVKSGSGKHTELAKRNAVGAPASVFSLNMF